MVHDRDQTSAARPGPPRWARRAAVAALIVIALAVHASLWSIGRAPEPRPLWGDEHMYLRGGTQLAAGESWHPPPLWPPLYPYFLAVVLTVGGGSLAAVWAAQTLILGAVALLLRDLTRHLTGSRWAGDVAAAVAMAYPPLAAFAHYLWPEIIHLLWFVGALWVLACKPARPPWLLAAGALLGLTLLTKSLVGPFIPILLLPLVLEGSIRDRALRVLWVAVALGAVVAPAVNSNHRRGNGLIIADSLPFNVWVGLNERSRKSFVDPVAFPVWNEYHASAETYPERNAVLWHKIRAFAGESDFPAVLRRQLGRQYFRFFDRGSYLTDMLPGGGITARGGGYRDPPAALASGLILGAYTLYAGILVGTVAGMVVCPGRRSRWLAVGLLFIAYNLAIFLLLHVKSRFRVPLLPFWFLYTGCAVAWAAHRLGINPEEAELWSATADRRRWWAAAPAILLVLVLAFGREWIK